MGDRTPWITLVGAIFCALFAVLVTIENGFGIYSALLAVLAILFAVVTIIEPGAEVREWFVRTLSRLWGL